MLLGAPILAFAMMKFGYPFGRVQDWYNVWFHPEKAPQELMEIHWLIQAGNGIGIDPTMWHLKGSVFGLWSDFIFANIGADFGVVGMLVVVALFCWFGYRAMGIALNAPIALRLAAGGRPDRLDSRAGRDSHRRFIDTLPGYGTASSIHVVWRFVAGVMS